MPASAAPSAPLPAPCTCTIGDAQALPFAPLPAGGWALRFDAPPGLYQFSAIIDAPAFNWEELYIHLHKFGNTGQRTGPWDFDLLHENVPLVPSYWVTLNGQELGLWYSQRISLDDLATKRFRGNLAFHLATAGVHELCFRPYRDVPVSWPATRLEADPEDTLAPLLAAPADWGTRCPAARWATPVFWQELRAQLDGPHAEYREPLRRAFAWLERRAGGAEKLAGATGAFRAGDLPLLVAMARLADRPDALAAALTVVDETIAQPHWGNPREGAYGCDGDMGAGDALRALAWAWHLLAPELGDERRARLREKLRLQGSRFFALTLLHRDYWGGSILQDHGKKAVAMFACAAVHLLGVVPEAALWVAYCRPRVQRSVDAMPRDGTVPPSSHYHLYLYLDDLSHYREALLALTGEDVLDQPPLPPIVDFVAGVLRAGEQQMLVAPVGAVPFIGANAFFNQMAAITGSERAAALARTLLGTPERKFYHPTEEGAYYHSAFWGLLTANTGVAPAAALPAPAPLQVYADSGLAHYRDPRADVTLSLRCGPWCGHHAYRHATGPCDRMEMWTGAGHFILAIGGKPLLITPDGGYRLRSNTRSVLLVDDAGPIGDVGYTMSIPSFRYRGEELAAARWDGEAAAGAPAGWVRLDLGPAYANVAGLAQYTREFVCYPGARIVCRDTVVCRQPHQFAWLFQAFAAEHWQVERGLVCRVGKGPAVRLEARPVGVALSVAICPTEVVFSYASANQFQQFAHARFATATPVAAATVEFHLTW